MSEGFRCCVYCGHVAIDEKRSSGRLQPAGYAGQWECVSVEGCEKRIRKQLATHLKNRYYRKQNRA